MNWQYWTIWLLILGSLFGAYRVDKLENRVAQLESISGKTVERVEDQLKNIIRLAQATGNPGDIDQILIQQLHERDRDIFTQDRRIRDLSAALEERNANNAELRVDRVAVRTYCAGVDKSGTVAVGTNFSDGSVSVESGIPAEDPKGKACKPEPIGITPGIGTVRPPK